MPPTHPPFKKGEAARHKGFSLHPAAKAARPRAKPPPPVPRPPLPPEETRVPTAAAILCLRANVRW